MLRTIRTLSAIICFTLVTLLFLDFTGTLHLWFGWLAKIQLVPAILALNVGVVIGLLLLTLLFGRIYCSVICPLGVFQDIIAWVGKIGKKRPYTYSPAISWLRYALLAVFIVALIFGVNAIYTGLEPYSAYGRIASGFLAPVYQWGNNLLAYASERIDSYAFYETEVWIKSVLSLGVGLVTFVILAVLAWRNGRTYCNTICPVGTVLGFVSRFSVFKPVINLEECNSCGLCARSCKAACIDAKNHQIDYSRCVVCMDCIGKCHTGAIQYTSTLKKKKEEGVNIPPIQIIEKNTSSRRSFFTIGAGFALNTILKGQEVKGDGGFIDLEDKVSPQRTTPITPPGALSLRNITQNCTACQLCVSVCSNHVLSPSGDLARFMQPEMSFERGYCRPECVKCSEVCPTSAISSITTADKSAIQVGHAIWIKDRCVVLRDGQQCNNCERHCPTNAIHMVAKDIDNPKSLTIPVIDEERCIGCGACENLCPARPLSAIYVEGHLMHRTV